MGSRTDLATSSKDLELDNDMVCLKILILMDSHLTVKASDGGAQGSTRRCRPRPMMDTGPSYAESSVSSDLELEKLHTDNSPSQQVIFNLPYVSKPCEICDRPGVGHFIITTLRNAIQHFQDHREMSIIYQCGNCRKQYVNQHGALSHLPKCPGPKPPIVGSVKCEQCPAVFRTRRGLSTHERAAHPVLRNMKRAEKVQPAPPRGGPKGYGKVWTAEEISQMMKLEVRFHGHLTIAKMMTPYFPTKTSKQIRDKRREAGYRKMLESQSVTLSAPVPNPNNSGRPLTTFIPSPDHHSACILPNKDLSDANHEGVPTTKNDDLKSPSSKGSDSDPHSQSQFNMDDQVENEIDSHDPKSLSSECSDPDPHSQLQFNMDDQVENEIDSHDKGSNQIFDTKHDDVTATKDDILESPSRENLETQLPLQSNIGNAIEDETLAY
jgi:hypothetical protein